MKTDKEYPATHSMSTAWYVADEDGNVAIIDYNENGPVPWETEQTGIEDLIYGHCEDYKTKEYITIDLTDDQIDDLMENPHQPEDEDFWFDCIFQIDINQEQDFLQFAKRPDMEIELCISRKRGLYSVLCLDCTEKRGKKYVVKKSSALKKMIDRGMIKQIFNAKNFYISDEFNNGKVRFEYYFSSAPYYIYAQPYWTEFLAERINIPVNPVKLNQIPQSLRERIPRVPIKFNETPKIQIAEWIPCCLNSNEKITINGVSYQPIVLTSGIEVYVYTSKGGIEFFDYCSERKKYDCKECTNACCVISGSEFSNKPTVMFVFHPFSDYNYKMTVKSDAIIRHSVRIPLLQKIPYKHPKGYWMTREDAMEHVTEEMLTDFILKNYRHFEDTVLRINPRVIILEEKTKDLLSRLCVFDDERHIRINGHIFPCYLSSELEEYKEEIMGLAILPYRGIEMPYIISVEEMEQYKKKNETDL